MKAKLKPHKLLSMLLALVMLLSLLPTTALAAYPDASKVYVDGDKNFYDSTRLYYKNGDPKDNFTGTSTEFNAAYDPATGTLTLKDYNGKGITVGGAINYTDITVVLKGTNIINDGSLENAVGGDITITSESGGTLSITNKISDSNNDAIGIETGLASSYTTGNVTIKGDAKVTINMTHNGTKGSDNAYGIYAEENITISENASVDIICATPNNTTGGNNCNGLVANKNVTIDTNGTIKIDVTNAGGDAAYSYGIRPTNGATLTKVGEMEVKWKKHASISWMSGGAITRKDSFDTSTHAVNVDETNCYASYRNGESYTVTVVNGDLTGPGVPNKMGSGMFLVNDTVNITPYERKSNSGEVIPFKEWTAEGMTLTSPTTASNSFTVANKDVTVTATYNPFDGTPVFTRTSDSSGTIAFQTAVKPDGGTEYFEYVKVGKENDPYEYRSIAPQPTTASTASSYEYSVSASNYYTGGDIKNLEAGDYRMAVTLNGERYLSDPFTVNYTAAPTGNYPDYVRVYNGSGTITSLSDGQYLAANAATGASDGYTDGTSYVARYDKSTGTLYLNGYQNDHQIIAPDSVIFANGDLNIEVVSDSGFSTSVSATNDLYGIRANGTLNISGSGKLTVTANGNGTVYGIYADKGVTISAPLDVNVGKVDSSTNGPVHGIYAQSGTISLSGNDMTVNATGGTEAAYGVYNETQTSSSAAGNGNIDISGNLTVNLSNGSSNVGIRTGSGGTITLNDAKVNIPGNFKIGIYNNNGNVVIKNKSDVTLTSDVSNSWGVYAKYGGDLIIENSTVKVSADSLAACLERGNVSIKDSKVELTSKYKHYEVIRTGNSSLENTINLSGEGSVTLTASGNQTGSMIAGKVTLGTNTKCVKGTFYDSYQNYDGEYDATSDKTVLQFVHESAAPATYTVSFDANGGTGTMADVTDVSGEYTLPANGFTAPDGTHFKCWSVGGSEKAVGDTINVTANTTVIAQWTTKLDPPTNLVWDSTTAKWDAVTGADKYRVILYASTSGYGGSTIFNSDIAASSKDFSEYMLPGMYYYFEVAAYNSANYSETFSGFNSSAKKQIPGSIGTVTGFAWSGNTISWTAVEGAAGYDVWVMKDGVQKGSVRNVSGTSLDLTSDIASGGEGTYYVSVSAYKLARGNYLAEGNSPAKIIGATPIYSAAVRNVSVNGTVGTAITETQVAVDLTNDTFKSNLSGNWITNLPAGLSQSVSYGGTTMAIITISGTPTAASTEQIAITIPADQLIVNTEDLTVTANADAKFNISAAETHTHVWDEATYNWAEDGSSCTAQRVCSTDNNHKETANATITSAEKTPATETVMGWTTYTATFTESWATTQTKDIQDIPVLTHTHTWGTPTYTWEDDGSACTAQRVCSTDNNHKETANATITSAEKTPATETVMGWTTYTATFTEDWATTQTKDIQDIPVLTHTHTWGTPTYTWEDDGSACTAQRVCSTDNNHKETANATITSAEKTPATETVMGWTTYTATFTESWATTQTKDIQDIPVLTHTHTWGTPTYTWEDDGSACTAQRVCSTDNNHKETANATITSAEKTPATETVMGWTTYTATFTESWATTQTKDIQDIPVLTHTHTWGTPTYTWEDDGSACTAQRVCSTDNNHKETANATITSAEKTPATETVMGWTTYTATFTESWATTQTKDIQDIPVLIPIPTTYTVTFDSKGGSAVAAQTIEEGQKATKPADPTKDGYTFKGWTLNGSAYDFSTPVTDNIILVATWQKNSTSGSGGGGGGVSTYAITVDSAKNGDVTVSPRNASKGTTVTLTVEPDKGYTLETITVTDKNGDEIELTNKGDGKYTFKMPAGKVYVEVTFMEDNSMLNFFVDVFPGDYYYDAVLWAAKNGITGGVDAAHFAPNATCTRAQVVTFLWRAAGSPAPKNSMMPFTDVPAGSYYETAVLWAAENGITGGTSATTFSPDAVCSRGQIVTFLWRSQKSPASDSVNPFADVAADAYYNSAVLWAAENGITGGTSATTFSPNNDCTRAQIVTFLYRCLG